MRQVLSRTFAICGFLAVVAILLSLVPLNLSLLEAHNAGALHRAISSSSSTANVCFQHPAIKTSLMELGSSPAVNSAFGTAGGFVFEHPTSFCGTLRRRALWENRQAAGLELTPLAREIEQQQSNCALPVGVFNVDNINGLGSHLHQWSQVVCNAQETGQRIRTQNPSWLWQDQVHCSPQSSDSSPTSIFDCYFPSTEPRCPVDDTPAAASLVKTVPGTFDKDFKLCDRVKNDKAFRAEWRAASMEYMFRQVSPLVLREAERQAGLLFPGGIIPQNLITVHIRWGDKRNEMKLVTVGTYINAVKSMLTDPTEEVNIFLSTEDPFAVERFIQAAPTEWKIYVDRTVTELAIFRPDRGNHASRVALNTKGRGGLMALGSLLVALEANRFVLTTESNWSRLINELRKNVLDRSCGDCTSMVDLMPGQY